MVRRTKKECCPPRQVVHELPDAELEAAAALFRVLADKTRLAILHQLREQGEVCACELAPGCCVGQSTLSHHLKVLRKALLVNAEKRGLWVYYSLNADKLADLKRLLP